MDIITYGYRVKGKRICRMLNRQAQAVSYVWNFCNSAQKHAMRWNKKCLSRYDLQKLTCGSAKLLKLSAQTVQAIGERYALNRKISAKSHLRNRGKKSLGWVPLTNQNIKLLTAGKFKYMGVTFSVWMSRPMDGRLLCGGSFSQDRLGRWYIRLPCEVTSNLLIKKSGKCIGVDLGLKTLATMSDGSKHEGLKSFRAIESKLATAQRARKKRAAAVLHAKAANKRRDNLHKLSTRLVNENALVAVGKINSTSIAKTRLAKGALDAGWGMLRTMLRYKAKARGVRFEEVDEYLSSQTCSACGSLPASRPRGIACLRIREWVCSCCGESHDRDINAARNILALALGGQRPAEGILTP